MQVVDVRNHQTLAGLAEDDVVEVPARIGAAGAVPAPPAAARTRAPRPGPARRGLRAARSRRARRLGPRTREAGAARQSARPRVRARRRAPGATARRLARRGHRRSAHERGRLGLTLVLAVDGGNTKTDLALLDRDGRLLSLVRGGGSSAHHLGLEGASRSSRTCSIRRSGVLDWSGSTARSRRAPIFCSPVRTFRRSSPRFTAGSASWVERAARGRQRHARSIARRNRPGLGNRGGVRQPGSTASGWPPTGARSGSCRSGDQRRLGRRESTSGSQRWRRPLAAPMAAGRRRSSSQPWPRISGSKARSRSPARCTYARLPVARLGELAPLVLSASEDDPVAAGIVGRLADEVIAFVGAAARRLELTAMRSGCRARRRAPSRRVQRRGGRKDHARRPRRRPRRPCPGRAERADRRRRAAGTRCARGGRTRHGPSASRARRGRAAGRA